MMAPDLILNIKINSLIIRELSRIMTIFIIELVCRINTLSFVSQPF